MGCSRGASRGVQHRQQIECGIENPTPNPHYLESSYLGTVSLLWKGENVLHHGLYLPYAHAALEILDQQMHRGCYPYPFGLRRD